MISENPIKKELIYKKYDFENLDNLSELYQLCFDHKPTFDYFKWKYLDNPAGKAIAFIAIDKETIAGFYGVIPEFFLIKGKLQVIYQSMDTMTHPNYRRLGLFHKLANMTYDYIRKTEGQIHLIGFPGEMSYGGFVEKLHWNALIHLKYLFTYNYLFKTVTMLQPRVKYTIEKISTFGEEFDKYFTEKEPPGKPFSKYINRAIANWRLVLHPDMNYQIASIIDNNRVIGYFSYYEHQKGRIFIVNIDVLTKECLSDCLNKICQYLFSQEKARAIYTFQSDQSLQKTYKKSGFISNPFSKGPFSYRTPFIVYGDKEISGLNWFDPNNFSLQPVVRDY